MLCSVGFMLYRAPVGITQRLDRPMGTIVTRKRKDGSTGHHAQVAIKRGGAIVHRETRTFDRRRSEREGGDQAFYSRPYH